MAYFDWMQKSIESNSQVIFQTISKSYYLMASLAFILEFDLTTQNYLESTVLAIISGHSVS